MILKTYPIDNDEFVMVSNRNQVFCKKLLVMLYCFFKALHPNAITDYTGKILIRGDSVEIGQPDNILTADKAIAFLYPADPHLVTDQAASIAEMIGEIYLKIGHNFNKCTAFVMHIDDKSDHFEIIYGVK